MRRSRSTSASDTMPGSSFLPARSGPVPLTTASLTCSRAKRTRLCGAQRALSSTLTSSSSSVLVSTWPSLADALDQPLRVLGGEVALRLGLLDQIVGDGLDEAVGPGRILHGTGIVQGENDVGLLGRDAAVVVVVAAQLEDVRVLDAAARLDFRDRDRVQYCHSQPPANPGEGYGLMVTIPLMKSRGALERAPIATHWGTAAPTALPTPSDSSGGPC